MANKDWAHGFSPLYQIGGGAPVINYFPIYLSSSTYQGTDIYKNQIVILDTTKRVCRGLAEGDTPANILGVSAQYVDVSAWIARGEYYIGVYAATKHIFSVQSDCSTTTTDFADYMFKNFDTTAEGEGDSNTGVSKCELDYATGGTNAADPIMVIGLVDDMDGNKWNSSTPDVKVRFNPAVCFEHDTAMT